MEPPPAVVRPTPQYLPTTTNQQSTHTINNLPNPIPSPVLPPAPLQSSAEMPATSPLPRKQLKRNFKGEPIRFPDPPERPHRSDEEMFHGNPPQPTHERHIPDVVPVQPPEYTVPSSACSISARLYNILTEWVQNSIHEALPGAAHEMQMPEHPPVQSPQLIAPNRMFGHFPVPPAPRNTPTEFYDSYHDTEYFPEPWFNMQIRWEPFVSTQTPPIPQECHTCRQPVCQCHRGC